MTEDSVRRLARRNGYRLKKSSSQDLSKNQGEYMLVNGRNLCVLGSCYDADLDQIAAFLSE